MRAPGLAGLTMSSDPFVRPPPVGETFTLRREETHRTAAGLVVRYAGHSHKHVPKGGRSSQTIYLSFERGEQQGDEEISGRDDVLEGEIDALGTVLVVRGNITGLEITALATPTPPPLDEDEAWDLIEQAAAQHGLAAKNSGGGGVADGVLRYTATQDDRTVWSARLGMYTGRLWFLRP